MDKRIVVVIIVVILILIGGFLMFQEHLYKKVVVGDEEFSIPSNYQDVTVSENLVKLTSGDNVYFITKVNVTDIKVDVNKYVVHKNKTENKSVNVSHLDYSESPIYKTVVSDNSSVVHYWFLKNNKVFEIYTGTANSDTDNFILDIIKNS